MRVAVLCPGPSLATWLTNSVGAGVAGHCDLRIGVNHVAAAVPCHWWVALDWRAFGMIACLGRPWVFTRREVLKNLQRFEFAAGFQFVEDRHPDVDSRAHWARASMTAALVLAAELVLARPWDPQDFTERLDDYPAIELYGADLKGDRYFDGREIPHESSGRWNLEENYLGILADWLRGKGVELKRMAAPEGVGTVRTEALAAV